MNFSDTDLLQLLSTSRPNEFACFVRIKSSGRTKCALKGIHVLWVPCTQNGAVTLATVEGEIERQWHVCVDAQTLKYWAVDLESRFLVHHPRCACTCHTLRPITNVKAICPTYACFDLHINTNKLVNKAADACFRKWFEGGGGGGTKK